MIHLLTVCIKIDQLGDFELPIPCPLTTTICRRTDRLTAISSRPILAWPIRYVMFSRLLSPEGQAHVFPRYGSGTRWLSGQLMPGHAQKSTHEHGCPANVSCTDNMIRVMLLSSLASIGGIWYSIYKWTTCQISLVANLSLSVYLGL